MNHLLSVLIAFAGHSAVAMPNSQSSLKVVFQCTFVQVPAQKLMIVTNEKEEALVFTSHTDEPERMIDQDLSGSINKVVHTASFLGEHLKIEGLFTKRTLITDLDSNQAYSLSCEYQT